MRVTATSAFISALVPFSVAADATADSDRKLHFPAKFLEEFVRPATADEAAVYIVSLMSEDERQLFLSTPEDALVRFHIGLGTGIRNKFGLGDGNAALTDSMGRMHPESMSAEIIRKVWAKVRSDAGRDVVDKVEAIERTLRKIVLPNENYRWSGSPLRDKHRLTTVGELAADMNAAVDAFFSRGDSAPFARIRIEAVGRESAQISIRNGRLKPMSNTLAPQSLAELLGQLGPPPFGRHAVIYQDSVVRIFEWDALEKEPDKAAEPTPTAVTSPAGRTRASRSRGSSMTLGEERS
jgi:hypothetical protein